MNTDQDWARDLFERSREGEEPVWVADHTAMMRSGRLRKRVRTLTASGGAVLTAAVVAAVGIGVGGGVDRRTPDPSPGHGAPPTKHTAAAVADPSKVLDYVTFGSFTTKDGKGGSGFFDKYYVAVPTTTARDSMRLLTKLDPTLAHFTKTSPTDDRTRQVPDDDPMAQDMAELGGNAVWTDNGMPAASGILNLGFMDTTDETPEMDTSCERYVELPTEYLDPVHTSGSSWIDAASWGPCVSTSLPDGSTLMSSTKTYGPFVQATVVRKLPGERGTLVMSWQNFPGAIPDPHLQNSQPAPDPKRALSPNPITVDKLLAAMSDSDLLPPLSPLPRPTPPTTMLQASDFGTGWIVDEGSRLSKIGDLVVDNGCTNFQIPLADPQPQYRYSGKTPSGITVTASAVVDVMKPGSGPSRMADLRQHGTGGCDLTDRPYSRDTMTPVPAGTGDEAFIENWYGQGDETLYIRVGDDIVQVGVTTVGHQMPAFTQADRFWFAALAAKAAARHNGKG